MAVAARVNNTPPPPPPSLQACTQTHTRAPTPSAAVQITTLSQHCLSAFVFSASPPLFPSHVPFPAEPQGPGLKRCRDEGQRNSERERERRAKLQHGNANECILFGGSQGGQAGFIFQAGTAPLWPLDQLQQQQGEEKGTFLL